MRARRTVKERDIVKILVFGYDRTLIKSIEESYFIRCSLVTKTRRIREE